MTYFSCQLSSVLSQRSCGFAGVSRSALADRQTLPLGPTISENAVAEKKINKCCYSGLCGAANMLLRLWDATIGASYSKNPMSKEVEADHDGICSKPVGVFLYCMFGLYMISNAHGCI